MISTEKIEAWIKEVSERPSSAPLIIEYIAGRLRDLSERNEELRTENIALISGRRVEEYEQRIQHLEYQLELLKRQFGGEIPQDRPAEASPRLESMSILAYNSAGRVVRLPFDPNEIEDWRQKFTLNGDGTALGEQPRLLAVPDSEELLFVFSSGRVATQAVRSLGAGTTSWSQAAAPHPPRAGESLACLAPLSRFSLADSFAQISRRGYAKKIRAAMAQSILANHYIGSGVTLPADRTLEIVLSAKEEKILLVSSQGYLLCVDVRSISASVEESIRLASTDHLAAAFALNGRENLLFMTQIGKLIHWTPDRLETAALKTRGQALYSGQRREQGVHVVGAGAVQTGDWCAALCQDGQISLAPVSEIIENGAFPAQSELLAFATFSLDGSRG